MRALPYTIPVLITLTFMMSAATVWIWLAVGLVFLVSFFRKRIGRFSVGEVVDEYHFFHHDKGMGNLKTASGLFFVGFNIWIPVFLFNHPLSLPVYFFFIYSIVILNSNFAISLAHDLMHSPRVLDRRISTIILLQNGFFYLESDHIFVHHRYVGTPQDPATAKLGEGIYHYFRRSIGARMRIVFFKGNTFPQSIEPHIIAGNRIRFVICMIWLVSTILFGWPVFVCILAQYLLVTLIYESITYIQHYGLERVHFPDGRHEPVQLQHSWNCYYKTSAYMHFMMPVHSIHHLKEQNPDTITDFAGPSMPLPFATMMMTAFRPSVWFNLMDDKVAYYNRMGP